MPELRTPKRRERSVLQQLRRATCHCSKRARARLGDTSDINAERYALTCQFRRAARSLGGRRVADVQSWAATIEEAPALAVDCDCTDWIVPADVRWADRVRADRYRPAVLRGSRDRSRQPGHPSRRLERVSQRLTILAEDGRSKLRSPTKTVGVNHFAIRSRALHRASRGGGEDHGRRGNGRLPGEGVAVRDRRGGGPVSVPASRR